MIRSWLIKILLCFSHTHHSRRKQPRQQSASCFVITNQEKSQTISSCPSTYHAFSSPLKLSMLRKVRCRIQSRTLDNNLVTLPLSIASSKQQSIASFLNESKNCVETLHYEYTSSITPCKQYPSLIAIDISNNEFSQEQASMSMSSHGSHQHRYAINRQRPPSNDSPLSDTTINTSSSSSDIFTPISQKNDKTWRLKINDDLNKDGNRHFVMHKDSEESVRKRRQNKRAKRSEEKTRKIEEKIFKANQRWQKYSNVDYELVFFISRYYDQLPLCSNCQNYFVTHQTQFLAEDPRASLDYAADDILHSPSNKTITMKQAAKARLIKDYDKQTNILFNLCDTCLTKCEQIRNELKQINFDQKMSTELNSPNINSTPYQNAITDLNQIYINNLIQNHQIRLQQFYQQSQNIIVAQQYQQNSTSTINHQQLHYDLQSCIKQMQYHCLEILHLQYPGYSFSFPYRPSYNPQYLSYRYQKIDDESDTPTDDNRSYSIESDKNQQSNDDRLTIETCHGLVEYCNAPLDDFIRGLQVLKCLSNFNCYSS